MSRNSDKANTVLFRYQEQQAEAQGHVDYNSTQRPRSVQRAGTLKEAEAWRKQVVQEISQKVLKIQDPVLSDYQLRDLNDEINKLMRERGAWEYRIKELGGPDYRGTNNAGGAVMIRGYRYYGRAKELPGVKELLQKQIDERKEKETHRDEVKSRQQEMKELQERVGLDYYGYYDQVPKLFSDVKDRVLVEAREILGDLVPHVEEPMALKNRDELLKYERRVTRERLRHERVGKDAGFLLDDVEPPSISEVEQFLVARRRQLLEEKIQ